jgi:predicted metal-binding membrane protein
MSVLFVGGVMNALGIAVIALCGLAEKTLPWGGRFARVTGVGLAAWGVVSLAGGAG